MNSLKTHIIMVVVMLVGVSCSGQQPSNNQLPKSMSMKGIDTTQFNRNNIESNFKLMTLEEINKNQLKIYEDCYIDIPSSVLSDLFLIPLNLINYSNSYIANNYKTLYRFQLSDSLWILVYYLHYDQHFAEIVWNIYDNKESRITSKLIVSGDNFECDREFISFDGTKVVIYTKYKRHFENGFDGDNSKPIEVESTYIIQNNKFVVQ